MRPALSPLLMPAGITVAALTLGSLAGCGSAVLTPTTLPTPLLHGAGEIEATAYLGSNGIDLSAAGAVTGNLIATGVVSWDNRREGERELARHLYGEGGLGYNVPFRGGSMFTILAGAGTGSSREKRDFSTDQSIELTKTFLQVLFGSGPIGSYRPHPESLTFEGGVTVRGSRIDVRSAYAAAAAYDPTYFVEPRLFVRGLWGVFGCGMQFGMNLPLDEPRVSYSVINAAISLSVHFSVAGDRLSAPLDP